MEDLLEALDDLLRDFYNDPENEAEFQQYLKAKLDKQEKTA